MWNPNSKPKRMWAKTGSNVVVSGGIKFASETERDFHQCLTRTGIKFEFQRVIYLTGESQHKSAKTMLLRDRGADRVKLTVDFSFWKDGVEYFVDTKGAPESVTHDAGLRYLLLKHKLLGEGRANDAAIVFVYAKDVRRLANMAYVPALFWETFLTFKHF